MESPDHDEINFKSSKDNHRSWGVEVEFLNNLEPSIFRTVSKIILDNKSVRLYLPDGVCESFPNKQVRKVLSMVANDSLESNGGSISADELY
jgi:hypothetical protein